MKKQTFRQIFLCQNKVGWCACSGEFYKTPDLKKFPCFDEDISRVKWEKQVGDRITTTMVTSSKPEGKSETEMKK